MINYQTENGNITLNEASYADIISVSAEDFSSRLMFSTPSGKPVAAGHMRWKSSDFMSAEYIKALNSVNLTIYVVMRFGISFSDTLSEFSDIIRKNVKSITGTDVGRIKFKVTGVKSKKLVRRDIEFLF